MKTKETSTREQAMAWWNKKRHDSKRIATDKHFGYQVRHYSSLTGREIEEIYNKEVLESKRQESQVNRRYTKPNAKEFKQLDESLFKSYMDKFSDEDKIKAFEIIVQEISKMVILKKYN